MPAKVLVTGQAAQVAGNCKFEHMMLRVVSVQSSRERGVDVDLMGAERRRRRVAIVFAAVDAVGSPQQVAEDCVGEIGDSELVVCVKQIASYSVWPWHA